LKSSRLKIALISTAVFTSPVPSYGGLEQVVWELAVGLSEVGHKVTLIAPKGSKCPPGGELIETVPPSNSPFRNPEEDAYKVYKDRLEEFNIINDHSWMKYAYIHEKADDLPLIGTVHGQLPYRTPPPVKHPCFVGVSKAHAEYLSGHLGIPVEYAYNGIDLDLYPFKEEKGDYLLFLARMSREKGAHEFVQICKKVRMKGVVAGSDKFVDDPRYVERVMQMCDGRMIRYLGEVPFDLKVELLQNAKALVCPLLPPYIEVFGLTTVEANACGTPVISVDRGACRELIKNGVNGFVVRSIFDIPKAIKKLDKIDPKNCRKVGEKFSRKEMTKRYIQLYKRVLRGQCW